MGVALRACRKDVGVRVTRDMTAPVPDSRTALSLKDSPTLWITAAPSAPALSEAAPSAAATSGVRICHQTALRLWSLRTVASSVNALDVFTEGRSMRQDIHSTSKRVGSATVPMKEGSSCATLIPIAIPN